MVYCQDTPFEAGTGVERYGVPAAGRRHGQCRKQRCGATVRRASGVPESIYFSANYLLTDMGCVRMLRQLYGRR